MNTPDILKNLVWESGEMYYVDDEGKRIDKPIDRPAVEAAMMEQMRAIAPKKPLKVNGVEVDREALLKAELENTR